MDRLTWFLVWDAIGRTWLPLFGMAAAVVVLVGAAFEPSGLDRLRHLIGFFVIWGLLVWHRASFE